MCPYPIYIKKHNLEVPCGKCGYCAKRSISDWTIRCKWELKSSLCCYFLTLTYEQNPITLHKKDLQDFFKRLRKSGYVFTYFALGDYGDTYHRPHYHVLLFLKNKAFIDRDALRARWGAGDDRGRKRGFVTATAVTIGRIQYVVSYGYLARLDWDKNDKRDRPFFLMSKRPALGATYVSSRRSWHLANKTFFVIDSGYKKPMPRYLKGKVFAKHSPWIIRRNELTLIREAERRDRILLELTKSTNKPLEKYVENEQLKAAAFLEKLRKQKRLKNKLLNSY